MSQNIVALQRIVFPLAALLFIGIGQLFAYGSSSGQTAIPDSQHALKKSPDIYIPRIIKTYPHDPRAFTQGLVFANGYLYEGTGLYGASSLRKVVLESGHVEQKLALPAQFFGEGITIVQDMLIQLTWRSHVGFVYARDSFKLIRMFQYSTEGWGVTYDGRKLIMSDGTEQLYFLNPETYEITGKVSVYDDTGFVTKLNELEFIKGQIYANVWQSSRIAIIDPLTGQVNGWIELQEIVRNAGGNNTAKTLNGIAYDEKRDRLLITGKQWPYLYEIRLIPVKD